MTCIFLANFKGKTNIPNYPLPNDVTAITIQTLTTIFYVSMYIIDNFCVVLRVEKFGGPGKLSPRALHDCYEAATPLN